MRMYWMVTSGVVPCAVVKKGRSGTWLNIWTAVAFFVGVGADVCCCIIVARYMVLP